MAKIRKGDKKEVPAVSTAALPDIVFMLLFFFMVTTVMRENELKISVQTPKATQLKKLEKKSLVSYIFIGKPQKAFQNTLGTEPRVQLNDELAKDISREIGIYVASEREKLPEIDRPKMWISLKVDHKIKMGILTDVKEELRKAQALKINYSAKLKVDPNAF